MQLLKEEKISKEITGKYSCNFTFPEDGLYLIEIIASAKSWWQNFKTSRSFFKDDDISLFLDNQELTTSKYKKGDARSAWNGNELCGLEKTVIIAANLSKGKHVIDLRPDQIPYLKSLSISKVEEQDKITYIPNKITYIPTDNNPAQKSEGRPWLSYIILDLFITKLYVSAKANKNDRDDDDIKLIINGKIQKNENTKSHRDWYWCGKILKGEEKSFYQNINSHSKQFNLDLYSDDSPFLYKIEIEVKSKEKQVSLPGKIIPTVDNPFWTGNFEDDTEEMLLARLIFGEASGEPREAKIWVAWSVINRTKANSWWPKTIQGVILQKGQYDPIKPSEDPLSSYQKIINPLSYEGVGIIDKESWHECYQIAREVIAGEIKNPTTATHIHGIGVTRDWFEKNVVPNGKFLKKIGNTYFYWSPN